MSRVVRIGAVPGQSPLRLVSSGADAAGNPPLDQIIFDANYSPIRVLQKGSMGLGTYSAPDPRTFTHGTGVLAVASGSGRYIAIAGRWKPSPPGATSIPSLFDMQFYRHAGWPTGTATNDSQTEGVGIAVDGTNFYCLHWNGRLYFGVGESSDVRYLIFRNAVG